MLLLLQTVAGREHHYNCAHFEIQEVSVHSKSIRLNIATLIEVTRGRR